MAELRFRQSERPRDRRPELAEVKSALLQLRAADAPIAAGPRLAAERERTRAWERARHISGVDPNVARRSDDQGFGYRIERRQYGNAVSPFGWFIENGQALAYYGKEK
jgi:hypothetical protein